MGDTLIPCKPFLKWVGGKRGLLDELKIRIPEFNRYFEPFLGGGAMFFALQPQRAHISDKNMRLTITYDAVKNNVEELIDLLAKHKDKHSKEHFLRVRSSFGTENKVELAAAMIYLNKTCFNGLYRVNKNGEFNVPFGRYKSPQILDEDNLRACSDALEGVEVFCGDFSEISPSKDDFVYLDPPYHTTYSQYDDSGFAVDEHKQLAQFCQNLDKQGIKFMLSNSDTELIRRLFADFNIDEVNAPRYVSCKADGRKKQQELIICNYSHVSL